MIIVKIQAGLGNQMFSYATAWALQQKTGEKVYAIYDITGDKTGRKFSLSNTNAVLFPECPKWIETLIYKLKKWEQRIKRRDLKKYEDVVKSYEDGFCCAPIRRYIDADMTKSKVKYLDGTFQSQKYFEKYSDVCNPHKKNEVKSMSYQIKEMFKIQTTPSAENEKILNDISLVTNSVCLHIRLGDYKWGKYKRFQVCTEKYYKKAIVRMLDEIDSIRRQEENKKLAFEGEFNPQIFVFSEDQSIVKSWNLEKVCGNRAQINYVGLNNPDYEELRLMYSCKHFIISNSTFSWWAQYLSDNDDKIVIAPNRWMNEEDNSPMDIYEDNWICLDVD